MHTPQVNEAVEVVVTLVQALGETEDEVLRFQKDGYSFGSLRHQVATTLEGLSQRSEPLTTNVIIELLALARDERVDASTRCAVAQVLGQSGRGGEAAEILLELARDKGVDAWVRRKAAEALGQLDKGDEAVEILLALARDASVEAGVQREAAEALGQLGRSYEAVEILLSLVGDASVDTEVRRAAYKSLKALLGGEGLVK